VTLTRTTTVTTKPSFSDIRGGLAKTLLDDFQPAWAEICRSAGIAPDCHDLDDEAIDHLLEVIAGRDPLCRVLAMSWRIRRTAAQKLAEIGR
jgi:hypothetical protein